MKKVLAFLLSFILLLMPGCQTANRASSASGKNVSQGTTLTVCYPTDYNLNKFIGVATAAFKAQYPDVTVREIAVDPADGDARQKLFTSIMAGQSEVDVVIDYNGLLFENLQKVVQGGAFVDLSGRLDTLPMDEYSPVFAQYLAGDGPHYLLPLSYSLPAAFALPDVADSCGFQAERIVDASSCIAQLSLAVGHAGMRLFGILGLDYASAAARLLASLCPEAVDPVAGRLDLEASLVRQYMDLLQKDYRQNRINTAAINEKACSNVQDGLAFMAVLHGIEMFLGNYDATQCGISLPDDIPELVCIPIPNGGGGSTAILSLFGGILPTSQQQDLAWEYLRHALGKMPQDAIAGSDMRLDAFPMKTSSAAFALDKTAHKESGGRGRDGTPMILPRSQYATDFLRGRMGQADTLVPDEAPYRIIMTNFLPYLEGRQTYEACAEAARREYRFYLDE